MNANTLLADPAAIEIDKFVSESDAIIIVARSLQASASCPKCKAVSSSLKGHYLRQLTDLPWHNVSIRLQLKVTKFRYRNSPCTGKVCSERLSKVAEVYARRTQRLAARHLAVTQGEGEGSWTQRRRVSLLHGRRTSTAEMKKASDSDAFFYSHS